jgi:DNA-binding response OmpR family regulator
MNAHELPLLLIVDDDPDQLFFIRHAAMKTRNFIVLTASGGWNAIGLLQSRLAAGLPPPDLILTDLKMPDLSGIDLALALRQRMEFQQVPIFLLSSSSCPLDRQTAARAGVKSFVQKPIRFEELSTFIETLVRFAARCSTGEPAGPEQAPSPVPA